MRRWTCWSPRWGSWPAWTPPASPTPSWPEACRCWSEPTRSRRPSGAGLLEAFDSQDGHVADGQRTARTWLVHLTRVTKGQAAEHQAVERLAREHPVLLAGLAEGRVLTKSVALQLAKWTRAIPGEYRDEAEEIVMAAARAGADLRALAAICAEIRYLYRAAGPGRGEGQAAGPRGVV